MLSVSLLLRFVSALHTLGQRYEDEVFDVVVALQVFLGCEEVYQHIIHEIGYGSGVISQDDIFEFRELFGDTVVMDAEALYGVGRGDGTSGGEVAHIREYVAFLVCEMLAHMLYIVVKELHDCRVDVAVMGIECCKKVGAYVGKLVGEDVGMRVEEEVDYAGGIAFVGEREMACQREVDDKQEYVGVDAGFATHLGYRLVAEAVGYGKTAQERHYVIVALYKIDHRIGGSKLSHG